MIMQAYGSHLKILKEKTLNLLCFFKNFFMQIKVFFQIFCLNISNVTVTEERRKRSISLRIVTFF